MKSKKHTVDIQYLKEHVNLVFKRMMNSVGLKRIIREMGIFVLLLRKWLRQEMKNKCKEQDVEKFKVRQKEQTERKTCKISAMMVTTGFCCKISLKLTEQK